MDFIFENKKISGVLTVIPPREIRFEDEIDNYDFPRKSSLKLQKVMKLGSRRVVEPDTCGSDLCLFGMQQLLDRGLLRREDIDALLYVSQTPDHFIPPTSNLIQGKLGLGHDVFCLDINQGCAGYVVGLYTAFMMLDMPAINKVILLNADTASKQVSSRDRASNPLAGDGASITVVEVDPNGTKIIGNLKMDGSRGQALCVPAGGYRIPASAATARTRDEGDHNPRSLEHIHMDGNAIFQFTMQEVPKMIADLLRSAGTSKDDIDYYLFHQPNGFILERIAEKIGVAVEKMPNNLVETYGNLSSVTIPAVMTMNLGASIQQRPFRLCMAGFGVGLAWASMIMEVGPLDFCELIEYGGVPETNLGAVFERYRNQAEGEIHDQ